MFYFVAFLLTLIVPIVGFFTSIHFANTKIDDKTTPPMRKLSSIISELIFISSPSIILLLFGFLTVTSALCIALGCIAFFAIALAIQNGNDIESFAMTAIMAIVVSHFFVSVSHAYEVYQRRRDAAVLQESAEEGTNPTVPRSDGAVGS